MSNNKENFIFYYDQFKDKIFNYFLYRVGFNSPLAEDLTSEVFIKALRAFANFDENKIFKSWIYAIAHNHLVNYYSRSGRDFVPLEEVEDFLVAPDENKIEEKYETEQVLTAIDSMAYYDREVLRLKFVDELNNKEIAEIVDKEEGAVRTQVSRSLSRLRKILNKKLD